MKCKKSNLGEFVCTLSLEGTDKVKQDLKEIEERLDTIIEKYEKVAALKVQVQEQPEDKFIPEDSNGKHFEESDKCTLN